MKLKYTVDELLDMKRLGINEIEIDTSDIRGSIIINETTKSKGKITDMLNISEEKYEEIIEMKEKQILTSERIKRSLKRDIEGKNISSTEELSQYFENIDPETFKKVFWYLGSGLKEFVESDIWTNNQELIAGIFTYGRYFQIGIQENN